MPIPQTKDDLITAIKNGYEKLEQDLKSIPTHDINIKTLEGHKKNTQMSVHNAVSYLVGWGELVLKWNEKDANNEEIDFPDTGFKWNQLGDLAQKFYTDYQELSYVDLLEKFKETIAAIIKLITSYSQSELYGVLWYKTWTRGRMIQLNTSSPYKNARTRIRKWKRENNIK